MSLFGLSDFFSQAMIFAQANNSIELHWVQAIIGYGPLGIFAVAVALDKIGNHSERNRLRAELATKDEYIRSLHAKIEDEIVPAIINSGLAQTRSTETLTQAIELIQKMNFDRERDQR